jgi:hypothetical protein
MVEEAEEEGRKDGCQDPLESSTENGGCEYIITICIVSQPSA